MQLGKNIDTVDVVVPQCDKDNPNAFKWSPDIDLSKYETKVSDEALIPKV